jgi:hypothetical protein
MLSREFLTSLFQGFFFRKVVPGILIGLMASQLDPATSSDAFTFILSMVVFWSAIGVGHGLADLTTRSQQ